MPFLATLQRTWQLTRASWTVLREDREVLAFPLLSGFCCLLIAASFILPIYHFNLWTLAVSYTEPSAGETTLWLYGLLFLFYLGTYFITTYFNAALMACATLHMIGRPATVEDGLRIANRRIGAILGWAFISATVGVVLQAVQERASWLGSLLVGLAGLAWALASFLVVPVIVVEDCTAREALKRSTTLIRQTWGEQVTLNVGFGLLTALVALPFVAVVAVVWVSAPQSALAYGVGLLAGAAYIAATVVVTALQSIFRSALYLYVRHDRVPFGFTAASLGDAVEPRTG